MVDMKFKKVGVFGLGKVGSLVATLLHNTGFDVTGVDAYEKMDLPFECDTLDVTDKAMLTNFIQSQESVVSCLPYFLNMDIAKIAADNGVHYFDLTEDVPTTNYILDLAKTANCVMAPQCGLAPGVIGIIGADLAKDFDSIRHIKLRVGALPQNPTGLLGYSFTWSADGVINEYLNDCEVIENGERKTVSPLEWFETVYIDGQELEAFTTSGGLGTMCETYADKAENLDYKSMRYPGHGRQMNFLLHELLMRDNPRETAKFLSEAKPPVADDIVYVHAAVEGEKDGAAAREEFVNAYKPIMIGDEQWRAISWTTAASICAVIEMVASGQLPDKGFIRQEDIPFDQFLETQNGVYYKKGN